ncbi:MAG: glycerophosphodiester phosphodiesterase family protein, partial [Clostridium sp.]
MEKQMRKHNRNKKSIYIWLAIACLAFILLNPGDSLQFTGHRGGRDLVPENTMPAFEMAIAEGADFAELDVQQTKDKVLVVFHDDNLARITGQDINIWDITYDELSKLDAGSYLSPEYVGVGIPTLQQVLKTCKGRLKLNIEIKMNGHATEDFVKQIIDMVTEEGCSNQCILTSFDYGAV